MEEPTATQAPAGRRPLTLTAVLFCITLGAYFVIWLHRVYTELRRAGPTTVPPLAAAGLLLVPGLNVLWLLFVAVDFPRVLRRLAALAPHGEEVETEVLSALFLLPAFAGVGVALASDLPLWLGGFLAWPFELPAVLAAQATLNRIAGTRREGPVPLRRDRETLASALLALLVAGGLAFALVAGSGDDDEQPARRGAPAGTDSASDVAYAAGSFWVTDARKGTLQRVDAKSGRPVGAPAKLGEQAIDIGAAEGALWVALYKEGHVARVDPRTARVVQRIPAGRGTFGIATGRGSIWATNQIERTVVQIDARNDKLAHKPFEVGQGPRGVDVGEGAAWVANFEGASVSRVDLDTGAVTTIPLRRPCHDVVAAYGSVWVSHPAEGFVTRLDPRSGKRIGTPITAGAGPANIEAGLGRVWVASGAEGAVTRIDPRTGGVSNPIKLRGQVADLTVARGAVWALLANGRVERVSK
jgi:streptogramin lyase